MREEFEKVFNALRNAIGDNVRINTQDTNEHVIHIGIHYEDKKKITVKADNIIVEGDTKYIHVGYDKNGNINLSTTFDDWTTISIDGDRNTPFVICTDMHGNTAKIRVGGVEICIPKEVM